MNGQSVWTECRLLSIDGSSSRLVGPGKARCTNAAWSPDGRWMYFWADAGDGFHVWRQRFPDGTPQQLTSGATEEEGLALDPDGRSLITSVGVSRRSVWIHDASGDHQVSLEGYAYYPLISADGRKLCFSHHSRDWNGSKSERVVGHRPRVSQTQRLFPGQLVTGYRHLSRRSCRRRRSRTAGRQQYLGGLA